MQCSASVPNVRGRWQGLAGRLAHLDLYVGQFESSIGVKHVGSHAKLIPLANLFKPRRRAEQKQNGESERGEAHRTMPCCEQR